MDASRKHDSVESGLGRQRRSDEYGLGTHVSRVYTDYRGQQILPTIRSQAGYRWKQMNPCFGPSHTPQTSHPMRKMDIYIEGILLMKVVGSGVVSSGEEVIRVGPRGGDRDGSGDDPTPTCKLVDDLTTQQTEPTEATRLKKWHNGPRRMDLTKSVDSISRPRRESS